jgi:hypothetical protein
MRRVCCALAWASMFLGGRAIAADPPRFVTNWKFEVKFSDGVQTYNENQTIAVGVWLPPNQGWSCLRLAPQLVDGRMRGSFSCSNDGLKTSVLTMVGCKGGEEDPPHAAGMRLYSQRPDGKPQGSPPEPGTDAGTAPLFGKWVDLAVTCETVRAR